MQKTKQTLDLCINCLNADNCSYPMNHTKPIIFCEEFTCTDSSKSKNDIVRFLKNLSSPIDQSQKGLCSNCDNAETCNLKKENEAVINCEEYR